MARRVLYDASDPDHVEEAANAEADLDKDLTFILSEPRGRRWLYHHLHTVCHVDRISHVPTDPHTSAFNEGGRAVGLALQEEIRRVQPDKYLLMLKENADE